LAVKTIIAIKKTKNLKSTKTPYHMALGLTVPLAKPAKPQTKITSV
jgi:hypothetical protein